MRVLVTGGQGFVGAWILKILHARGDEAIVFDLHDNARRLEVLYPIGQTPQFVFQSGDVTKLDDLLKAIDDHDIDHVIHLAGLQVPTCRQNPHLGMSVNVGGTLNVLEAARLRRDRVKRVVYASSAAVFSPAEAYPTGPLADEVPLNPGTHYGWFKICNEGNALVYHREHGVESVGLRPWTVYGVGRDVGMTSEPTRGLKCLALNRPHLINYGGWQDMQFVEDVAQAFVACLLGDYKGPKSYNLRGAVVDMQQFLDAVAEVEPASRRLLSFKGGQLPIAWDLSDKGIQTDYGPIPVISLVEGIRKTLNAFRSLEAEGRLDKNDLGS